MRISELDYDLPEELIAQEPIANRAEARMLVLDRKSESVEHSRFYKLARHLREGDLLVLNDTRVFPARLTRARKPAAASNCCWCGLSAEGPAGAWIALARTHRVLRASRLMLGDGHALSRASRPGRPIVASEDGTPIETMLQRTARPRCRITSSRRGPADLNEYQTVYARSSARSPRPPPDCISPRRCSRRWPRPAFAARVTLHIGPGTFTPVRAVEVEGHSMEAEWYTIPPATLEAMEFTRRIGGRMITVGTSSTRALESYAITGDTEGFTGLFIFLAFASSWPTRW